MYLIARLVQAIPSILGATLVAFLLLHAQGDPTLVLLNIAATEEQREAFREKLGLNEPLPVQYVQFVSRLAQGDLGTSFLTKEPVRDMIARTFPNTVILALCAQAVAISVSILLGCFAAYRRTRDRNSLVDKGVILFIALGQSMPWFFIALLLIYIFGVTLRVLPVSGLGGPLNLVLPVLTLALGYTAILTQVTRTQMLRELTMDYARTARAKGLGERVVVLAHVLRNVLIPIVTMVGISFGSMLGGIVVVELVFSWPGTGALMLYGVTSRDFPVVMGVLVFAACITISINFVVDMVYFALDPRVKNRA